MRTLSGAVIGKSREVYKYTQENSPLKRNVDLEEIGNAATYLVSDMSSGITGEIHYVLIVVSILLECQNLNLAKII